MQKIKLFVVGMHRSGTSVLTRCMNLGGFYLGKSEDLLNDPKNISNPKGNWEHKEFIKTNEMILEKLGGAWDSPPEITPSILIAGSFQNIRKKVHTLEIKFSSYPKVCFKDPRFLYTWPLWINRIKDNKPLFIGIVRHPYNVAKSLQLRDGFSILRGLILWELYNIKLLELKAGFSFPIITFQELLQDTEKTLHHIAGYVEFNAGIQIQFDFDQIYKYVENDKAGQEEPYDCPESNFYLKELSDIYSRMNNLWSQSELRLREQAAFNKLKNIYIPEQLEYIEQIVNKLQIDLSESKEPVKKTPLVSVIVPVYNIEPKGLDLCMNSVLKQTFKNWEMCVYNDGSTKKSTIAALRKWNNKDERIKIKSGKSKKGIAMALNEAVKMASGEYIALLDNVGELTSDALREVTEKIISDPNLKFIYSDEAIIDKNGRPVETYYKPDFNFDLFLSSNYISHLTVVKKSSGDSAGWFRKEYEGAYDYDLFLRCIEKLNLKNIFHIPKVLYHYRKKNETTTSKHFMIRKDNNSSIKALNDYLKRNKIDGQVLKGRFQGTFRLKRNIQKNELVSIIIPFKDKVELLENLVDSLLAKTEYKKFEILLINNKSKNRNTLQYLEKIVKRDRRISRFDYDKPFNYSALNNWAVKRSKGKYLLFLNNDTELISEEWLSSMVEHMQRREIGAVGAKLLYPNNTVQHAGIVLSAGKAEHVFRYAHRDESGYFGQLNLIRDMTAVTGACLLVKRNIFEEIRGFDEKNLKRAFNDVDLCLKIRQKDYLIVYTPYAELYHHESLSRGYDDTPRKINIAKREINFMREKWTDKLFKDPFFNPNLAISGSNVTVNSECLVQFLNDNDRSKYDILMNLYDINHNTGETVGNRHFCFVNKDKKGHCIYGPRLKTKKTIKFIVTFCIEFINIFNEDQDLINLDIYDYKNDMILTSKSISYNDLESMEGQFSLGFSGKRYQVLEFRVFWHQNCDIAVSKIILEKS